jgi:tetratricopeptide (TPR) repeat protein
MVDSKSRFEQASPHGIIGNETLLEHVHPNLLGYALLSDAFFNKMKELKLIDNEWSHEMRFEELLAEMPVNVVDSLKGAYQIRFMLNEWPFSANPVPKSELIKPKTELEKNILKYTVGETSWNKVQAQLYISELKQGNLRNALKISEAFALIGPLEEKLQEDVASLSIRTGNKPLAAFYYSKAFQLNKTIPRAQQLARIYTEIDEPEKALQYYSYLQSADNSNKVYEVIISLLKSITSNKQVLAANAGNTEILNKIASDYLQLRAFDPAKKYLSESLRIDSKNKETIQIEQDFLQLNIFKGS